MQNFLAINSNPFLLWYIITIDTIKNYLVAFFQQYVNFDFHEKEEGSPLGEKYFLLNHGLIYLSECVLKSTLRIKIRFLKILTLAKVILKRLTILAILAKSADFDSYLRITFARVNIFKNRFLILNLLFKTNSGRYIKPYFERKKILPQGGPFPFFMKIEIDILLKKSYQNTFFGINGHYIIKGMGWNSAPIEFLKKW